jgi:hypothetical protein
MGLTVEDKIHELKYRSAENIQTIAQKEKKTSKIVFFYKQCMVISIEIPKNLFEKLLALISESSNTSGYKINMQKSIISLYTNENNSFQFKMPFIMTSKI